VIDRIRTSQRLGLAVCAASLVLAAAGGPTPAAAQSIPVACAQALAYQKTAATDSLSAQSRYDSALAGLTANQGCRDAEMHLVNEAYLLSMRAPAEHDLHVGNWRQDLTRANMLLTQCANWPTLKGKKVAIDCDTQRRYNAQVAKTLDAIDRRTPAPAATAGARPPAPTPTPTPSGYRPPPPPQLSQPVGPSPSPTPHR
jgi:hypothetical protein